MHTNSYVYFSLAPNMYATCFDNAVIILDGKNDNYLSLIDDAADYFCFILKHRFLQKNNKYYCADAPNQTDIHTYWITHFIEKSFIATSIQSTHLTEPLKQGGLIGYRWDAKISWKTMSPFAHASAWDIINAYYMLLKISRSLKRTGISAIIDLLKKEKFEKNNYDPSEEEIKKLSTAVDAASILYPKKIYCLVWAATFAVVALKKGWRCNLVIGVQTNPFYAHAWAECTGKVINDDPMIAQLLSIIFREPYT
jgi:hypothetical protein